MKRTSKKNQAQRPELPMWVDYHTDKTPDAAMWNDLFGTLYDEYRRLQARLYGYYPYEGTTEEKQLHMDCAYGMALMGLVRDLSYVAEMGTN